MNRTLLNFWLNSALLVNYLALAWSSTILHLVFPPGPDSAGWSLWGCTYLQWRAFQFANTVVLTLGILFHVMLHWSWVCGVVATKIVRSRSRLDDGTQTLYGVGLLILLLVILLGATAVARLSIRSTKTRIGESQVRAPLPPPAMIGPNADFVPYEILAAAAADERLLFKSSGKTRSTGTHFNPQSAVHCSAPLGALVSDNAHCSARPIEWKVSFLSAFANRSDSEFPLAGCPSSANFFAGEFVRIPVF